jgi:hypothetical protein
MYVCARVKTATLPDEELLATAAAVERGHVCPGMGNWRAPYNDSVREVAASPDGLLAEELLEFE